MSMSMRVVFYAPNPLNHHWTYRVCARSTPPALCVPWATGAGSPTGAQGWLPPSCTDATPCPCEGPLVDVEPFLLWPWLPILRRSWALAKGAQDSAPPPGWPCGLVLADEVSRHSPLLPRHTCPYQALPRWAFAVVRPVLATAGSLDPGAGQARSIGIVAAIIVLRGVTAFVGSPASRLWGALLPRLTIYSALGHRAVVDEPFGSWAGHGDAGDASSVPAAPYLRSALACGSWPLPPREFKRMPGVVMGAARTCAGGS